MNFQNPEEFKRLEDLAIDGQLDYADFPPEEYKYFSQLTRLGYLNRHKGWGTELLRQLNTTRNENDALSLALRYIELIREEESGLEKRVFNHIKERYT